MNHFFTALNPCSMNSGILFSRQNAETINDVTVNFMLSLIWEQDLSVLEGIHETFNLLYGDHFDKADMHYGRKGLLDFFILPLFSRKIIVEILIKDIYYIEHRQHSWLLNSLAWIIATPIEMGRLAIALSLTIALAPVVFFVTAVRAFGHWISKPKKEVDESLPMPLPLAMAALIEIQRTLQTANLCTKDNLRRFLKEKESLKLVYRFHDQKNQSPLTQDVLNKWLDDPTSTDDDSIKAITFIPSHQTPTLAMLRLHWLAYQCTIGHNTMHYTHFRATHEAEWLQTLESEFKDLYPKCNESITHHPALNTLIDNEMKLMLDTDLLEPDSFHYTMDPFPL